MKLVGCICEIFNSLSFMPGTDFVGTIHVVIVVVVVIGGGVVCSLCCLAASFSGSAAVQLMQYPC